MCPPGYKNGLGMREAEKKDYCGDFQPKTIGISINTDDSSITRSAYRAPTIRTTDISGKKKEFIIKSFNIFYFAKRALHNTFA